MKYGERIAQWEGRPQKHNVKVLLCTLPDILWPGNDWKRKPKHKKTARTKVRKNSKFYSFSTADSVNFASNMT